MKPAHKLTTTFVHSEDLAPGLYNDGQGLYLAVSKAYARSWVFRYVSPNDPPKFETVASKGRNKVRAMGLGSLEFVTLEQAREMTKRYRREVAAGIDPLDQRDRGIT